MFKSKQTQVGLVHKEDLVCDDISPLPERSIQRDNSGTC